MGSYTYTAQSSRLTRIGRKFLRQFEQAHRFCHVTEAYPCVVDYRITRIGGGECEIAYTVDAGRELEEKALIYRYDL